MRLFSSFIIFIFFLKFGVSLRFQAASIKGRLLCGNVAAIGVRVKLWPDDLGMDVDKNSDQFWTDRDGNFSVFGPTLEGSAKAPVPAIFRIFHDCNDGNRAGLRVFKFRIPDSYVSKGKEAKKVFDFGLLNLEIQPFDEERSTEN
ncbi:unnamed protein product, partial [Mesorhabditis belari]|uniref:Transthyretin-like family protein n=1 Tax=Mesorhabditis belari TaxID=2138241 RepID=A0AAF3EL58_9BILA